jgi:hypothetical protein
MIEESAGDRPAPAVDDNFCGIDYHYASKNFKKHQNDLTGTTGETTISLEEEAVSGRPLQN